MGNTVYDGNAQLYPPNKFKPIDKRILIEDKRYGTIFVLQAIDSEQKGAVSEANFQNENIAQEKFNLGKTMMEYYHEAVVRLINTIFLKQAEMCST